MWGNKLSMVKYSKNGLASRETLALLRDDLRGFVEQSETCTIFTDKIG